VPDWVSDPEVWLGLFVMFGIPLWATAKNERAALSWRAFRYAAIGFGLMLVFGTLADMAGLLPKSVSEWLAAFWPKRN
jgi:hypothetical protein